MCEGAFGLNVAPVPLYVNCRRQGEPRATLYHAPNKELAYTIVRELQSLNTDCHFYLAARPHKLFIPLHYVAPASALYTHPSSKAGMEVNDFLRHEKP
tara:strand:- start:641 stop:934 length:294 start_codon:yes stop_codon:yes gene_type:complete